jgi:hypothetical protein
VQTILKPFDARAGKSPTGIRLCRICPSQILRRHSTSPNASEVAEPAKTLLLKYCCSRNKATQFYSSHCSWPVGTEAAEGGRSQQLSLLDEVGLYS